MAMDSEHARLTQEAKIIIWDEAPMAHKHIFEALVKLKQAEAKWPQFVRDVEALQLAFHLQT